MRLKHFTLFLTSTSSVLLFLKHTQNHHSKRCAVCNSDDIIFLFCNCISKECWKFKRIERIIRIIGKVLLQFIKKNNSQKAIVFQEESAALRLERTLLLSVNYLFLWAMQEIVKHLEIVQWTQISEPFHVCFEVRPRSCKALKNLSCKLFVEDKSDLKVFLLQLQHQVCLVWKSRIRQHPFRMSFSFTTKRPRTRI